MVAITEIRAGLRRGAAAVSLLVLAVVTSACDGGTTQQAPPTAPTGPGRQALPVETAAFCSAGVDLTRVVSDGPDVGDPPEAVPTAFHEYEARLEPPLKAMEKSAPAAVQQDIATIARQARYAVATNAEAPLNTPEYDTAVNRLRTFMISECGFEQVRVTALDYKFEGIPPTLPVGTVAFTLSNQGAESHELNVYRINEGVPQPFPELVLLPEAQRDVALTDVGAMSTNPGRAATEFITLIPGRYGVACTVKQGSTSTVEGTGPPHAAIGMIAEFTTS